MLTCRMISIGTAKKMKNNLKNEKAIMKFVVAPNL